MKNYLTFFYGLKYNPLDCLYGANLETKSYKIVLKGNLWRPTVYTARFCYAFLSYIYAKKVLL